MVWTRQEEFTWAYFHPAGLIEINGGVDAEGRFTALELHNYNSGAAGMESLYDIPNCHSEYHPADSPLRQPRLRAVLEAATERFGWGDQTPALNHGFGLACGFEKGSYVAACVEAVVNPANRQPKVLRVVEAYDCGALINPDNVRNQVEGAIIQGLGGALFESIKFANGRILNPSFGGYRVPRFTDVPAIDTILIDRKDELSTGAGETPIIAIAPAIGNAIFHATGVRLRSMPLAPHGVPAEA